MLSVSRRFQIDHALQILLVNPVEELADLRTARLFSSGGKALREGVTIASGSQLDIVLRWSWAGRREVPDGVRVVSQQHRLH